jgi:hypothetical protein
MLEGPWPGLSHLPKATLLGTANVFAKLHKRLQPEAKEAGLVEYEAAAVLAKLFGRARAQ